MDCDSAGRRVVLVPTALWRQVSEGLLFCTVTDVILLPSRVVAAGSGGRGMVLLRVSVVLLIPEKFRAFSIPLLINFGVTEMGGRT